MKISTKSAFRIICFCPCQRQKKNCIEFSDRIYFSRINPIALPQPQPPPPPPPFKLNGWSLIIKSNLRSLSSNWLWLHQSSIYIKNRGSKVRSMVKGDNILLSTLNQLSHILKTWTWISCLFINNTNGSVMFKSLATSVLIANTTLCLIGSLVIWYRANQLQHDFGYETARMDLLAEQCGGSDSSALENEVCGFDDYIIYSGTSLIRTPPFPEWLYG